jgi:predicted TIM-barrel fold metal-dependent hydrolase
MAQPGNRGVRHGRRDDSCPAGVMTDPGLSALRVTAYDAHQHVDFGGYSAGAPDATMWLRSDFEERAAMMKEAEIACSVLMPSYDYDKRSGLESTAKVIEGLLEYQSWGPDLFPWLGCTVEPQHYSGGVELLENTLAGGRFQIASWHNRYQGLSVDAPVMFEFAEVAARYDCVLFVHGTGNLDHEEAWRIAHLVRAFPHVRFVVLDAMMTYASMHILADLLGAVDNTWLDTAGATSFVHLVRHIGNTIGWHRILFGSDYYGKTRGGNPALMRHQLQLCDLSEDTLLDVFQRNLHGLLGAPPKCDDTNLQHQRRLHDGGNT